MVLKPSNQTERQLNNDWYIFKNCSKFGPLSAEAISELLDKNQINKDHHVWHQTYNSWVAIKDVELFQKVGFEVQINHKIQNFIEETNPLHAVQENRALNASGEHFIKDNKTTKNNNSINELTLAKRIFKFFGF